MHWLTHPLTLSLTHVQEKKKNGLFIKEKELEPVSAGEGEDRVRPGTLSSYTSPPP